MQHWWFGSFLLEMRNELLWHISVVFRLVSTWLFQMLIHEKNFVIWSLSSGIPNITVYSSDSVWLFSWNFTLKKNEIIMHIKRTVPSCDKMSHWIIRRSFLWYLILFFSRPQILLVKMMKTRIWKRNNRKMIIAFICVQTIKSYIEVYRVTFPFSVSLNFIIDHCYLWL